jgi:hypothetical protein
MKTRTRWRPGCAGGWVSLPLVVALLAPPLAHAAGGLEFSKDTVYESSMLKDSVALRNVSQDSLWVDTIVLLLDTTNMDMCAVSFGIMPYWMQPSPRLSAYYPRRAISFYYGAPVVLAAHDSLTLLGLYLDYYIPIGPLTKRAQGARAQDEWHIGDTIAVPMVLIAGTASDTVLVMGIRSLDSASAGVAQSEPEPGAAIDHGWALRTPALLNGRALSASEDGVRGVHIVAPSGRHQAAGSCNVRVLPQEQE